MNFLFFFMLFFALFSTSNSLEWEYEYQALTSDLSDVAHSGDTILAYGTNGVIMYSFDKGHNWHQSNIHRDNNIRFLQNNNLGYFGYSNIGFVWTKDLSLKTWQTKEFPEFFEDNFYTNVIATYSRNDINYILLSENLYIASENFDVQEESIFPSDGDHFFLNMFGKGDSLFIFREDNKLFILNLITMEYEEKDIEFPDGCTNCRIESEFGLFDEVIYLKYRGGMFQTIYSNDYGTTWENFPISEYFERGFPFKSIILEKDRKLQLKTTTIRRIPNEIDSLGFNFNSFRTFFNFEALDSNSQRVNLSDSNDLIKHLGISLGSALNPNYRLKRIDDETIILVAGAKRIIISFDNGKTWNVKSYFSNGLKSLPVYLNEKGELFAASRTNLFYSIDSGITWLPSLYNTTDLISSRNYANYHFENNKYLVNIINYTNPPDDNKNRLVFNVLDKNDKSYYIVLSDFQDSTNNMQWSNMKFNNINDKSVTSIPFRSPIDLQTGSYVLTLNEDLTTHNIVKYDSLFIIELTGIDGTLYAFARHSLTSLVSLYSSTDYGNSWKTEVTDLGNVGSIKSVSIDNKIIFIQQELSTSTYSLFNPQTKELKRQILGRGIRPFSYNLIRKMDENIIAFVLGDYLYYNSDSFSNSFTWDSLYISHDDDFNYIKNNLNQVLYNGKDLYFSLLWFYSMEQYTAIYKAVPKTPSSVENAETETPRSRAFLHAGKPYPLPAVSTVSADLHWNAQYSASEAVLKVFDSMGNEIPNAKVELQQTNPYSGTVTWDCGTYPTGVYFIQVTIGTEQKNVGVAVVR